MNYHVKSFRGGRNTHMLVCKNDKMFMPTMIESYVVNWYHKYLLHLGADCTEETIIQHYYWTNLREKIRTHIKVYKTCQKNKKKN